MNIIEGIRYNLKGLKMGLLTPRLLFLGLLRFLVVIILAIALGSIILLYQQEILSSLWAKPESLWILWLWYVVSWLLSAILVIFSTILSYVLSQLFFAVVIMDKMSRITESMLTGTVIEQSGFSFLSQLLFLVKQEIPRAIIPVAILLIISIIGLLTPFSPIIAFLSSLVAAIFLAWDNTDLVPARRLKGFKRRFGILTKNLGFHLGFGLLFIIPVFNILALSFAPVGATMFYLDKVK